MTVGPEGHLYCLPEVHKNTQNTQHKLNKGKKTKRYARHEQSVVSKAIDQ